MRKFWNSGFLLLGALAFGLFGFVALPAEAQTPPANPNFTVAGGKSATVRINVFSLQFGQPFPNGQNIEPYKVTDAKTISALNYAVSKDMDNADPRSLQLALWNLKDNTFHTNPGESKDKAQEIVNNANGTSTGPASTGTTLQDAIAAKQASAQITGVKSLKEGDFYGTAVIKVTNLTDKTLNLTLPFGSTFGVPGSNTQSLVGYVTGTESSAGAAAPGATVVGTPGAAGVVPGNATGDKQKGNDFPWWLLLIPVALLAIPLFLVLGRRGAANAANAAATTTTYGRPAAPVQTTNPVEPAATTRVVGTTPEPEAASKVTFNAGDLRDRDNRPRN